MKKETKKLFIDQEYISWKNRRKRTKALIAVTSIIVAVGGGVGIGYVIDNHRNEPTPTLSYIVESDKYLLKYGADGVPLSHATLTTEDSNGDIVNRKNVSYKIFDDQEEEEEDYHFVQIENLDQVKLLENPNKPSIDVTILAYLNSDLNNSIAKTKITLAQSDFKVYDISSSDVPAEDTNTTVYADSTTSGETLHKVINLKTLSNNNDGVTWFELLPLSQDPAHIPLDCVIFIPSDFSCHLVGTADSDLETVDQDADHSEDYGIVIANDTEDSISPSNVEINIWNLFISAELTEGRPAGVVDAIRVLSTVNGIINILNCSVGSFDEYKQTVEHYENVEGIHLYEISNIGKVSIIGNVFQIQSLHNMATGIMVDAVYGTLFVANNYINVFRTENWSYGICIFRNSTLTRLTFDRNVIVGTYHQTSTVMKRLTNLFVGSQLLGDLVIINNIFSVFADGDYLNDIGVNLLLEGGSSNLARVSLENNIFFRKVPKNSASDNEENRSMYFGGSEALGTISGTNNVIFDRLATDPKTSWVSTTDNFSLWYDRYTSLNKNVTFVGSNTNESIVQYECWNRSFSFRYFVNEFSGIETTRWFIKRLNDVLIVDNNQYEFSANLGDDKYNLLTKIIGELS